MIYIAHRGNIDGVNPKDENHPEYLLNALSSGYHVECDVRTHNGKLYLGHDEPKYPCNIAFLQGWGIWVHCKDVESLRTLITIPQVHCFFHERDPFTLTNKGYIWCYPRNFIEDGILVHPELLPLDLDLNKAGGICSDNIKKWIA